jgi:hypothetical protein
MVSGIRTAQLNGKSLGARAESFSETRRETCERVA